jgi:hypothetical protein
VLGLLVLPIDRRSRFRFHSEVEVNQTGDKYREIAVFGRRCHSHILLVVQNSSDETELRLLIDLVCRLFFFYMPPFLDQVYGISGCPHGSRVYRYSG